MLNSILQQKAKEINAQILSDIFYDIEDCLTKLRITIERALETACVNKTALRIRLEKHCNEIDEINYI